MLQLIYMSTAQAAPTAAELKALCEVAARNNTADEITGVLLSKSMAFIQAIEGPRERVEDTFIRIIGDDRHHSVTLLSRKLTTRREFGPWSMSTCDQPDERDALVEVIRSKLSDAPERTCLAFEEVFGSSHAITTLT